LGYSKNPKTTEKPNGIKLVNKPHGCLSDEKKNTKNKTAGH